MAAKRSLNLSLKSPTSSMEQSGRISTVSSSSTSNISPPGIGNIANNCYANAVLQCLMNHPLFLDVAGTLTLIGAGQQGKLIIMY